MRGTKAHALHSQQLQLCATKPSAQTLYTGPIVPAAIEQDDLAADRHVLDVALEVTRFLVPQPR